MSSILPDPSAHRLSGELRDTLEAIISGCVFLARGPIPPELLDPESEEFQALAAELEDTLAADGEDFVDEKDLVLVDEEELADEELAELESEEAALDAELGEMRDAYGGIALTVRVLARSLLARTLDRLPPTDVEKYYVPGAGRPETDNAVLDTLAHALLPPTLPAPSRMSRAEQKAAFEDALFVVREVGLEEFDVSCDLEQLGDGSYELHVEHLSPEAAHLELLDVLFDRAESVARRDDPLLATERDASTWEFMQWSVAPPPGRHPSDIAEMMRHLREQEYSLADRLTVSGGVSILEELADETFAELFPRQHRLAMALLDSVVGVFECEALDGNRVTMRSIRDGSTYVVLEQVDPIPYDVGWVGAGRLLPFGDVIHLRSPAMEFARAKDLDLMFAATNDIGKLETTLLPALAVEAFISTAMLGIGVPRKIKPMRSKADAREELAALQVMLEDEKLDTTLEGYIAALAEQANAGSGGNASSGTRAKRTAGRKGKKRRR